MRVKYIVLTMVAITTFLVGARIIDISERAADEKLHELSHAAKKTAKKAARKATKAAKKKVDAARR